MMGKYRGQHLALTRAEFNFYRATARGRAASTAQYLKDRSLYLYDVLSLCGPGIWERELRQFMPAASLQASLASLLDMGLIECTHGPLGSLAVCFGVRAAQPKPDYLLA